LEEKVQLLMKQRRGPSSSSSSVKSSQKSDSSKRKTKRSLLDDETDNKEANTYNEQFLDRVDNVPKSRINEYLRQRASLKTLKAKKPTAADAAANSANVVTLASKNGKSEYFQSDTFKKNKNRVNNPLRLKRLQLLNDQDFLAKHQTLGNFIYSKNKDNVPPVNQNVMAAGATDKEKTFQNRLPNLKDFNYQEKSANELDTTNREQTRSSLINDDLETLTRKNPNNRRTPSNRNGVQTLSMQKPKKIRRQKQLEQQPMMLSNHQSNPTMQYIQQQNMRLNTGSELNRPNSYFEAKERLLSNKAYNSERLKPSDFYHHNMFSTRNNDQFDQMAASDQAQGPMPSGLHFKLLKSKGPRRVFDNSNWNSRNVAAATEDLAADDSQSGLAEEQITQLSKSRPKVDDVVIEAEEDDASEVKVVDQEEEDVADKVEAVETEEPLVVEELKEEQLSSIEQKPSAEKEAIKLL
jgi:hypothetical protein